VLDSNHLLELGGPVTPATTAPAATMARWCAPAEIDAAAAAAVAALRPYYAQPQPTPVVVQLVVDNSLDGVAAVLAAAQIDAGHTALIPLARLDELAPIADRAWPGGARLRYKDGAVHVLRPAAAADAAQAVPPAAPATLTLFTSGSTGAARPVLYTWASWRLQGEQAVPHLAHGRTSADVAVVLTTAVAHAYALMGVFAAPHARWTLVIAPGAPGLAEVLRTPPPAAHAAAAIVVLGAPAVYERALAEHADVRAGPGRPAVAVAWSAGCPLPRAVAQAWTDRGYVPIGQNYGTTETGFIAFGPGGGGGGGSGSAAEPAGAVGRADPAHVTLQPPLADRGAPAPWTHEVCVHSPWRSLGYVVYGGVLLPHGPFYRTGDAGALAADGTLLVGPRLRAFLRVRAADGTEVRLLPADVESQLLAIPAVRAAAVVDVPGVGVGALVVPAAAADVVRATLPRDAPHRPALVVGVDALPTSAAGKVLLGEVLARLQGCKSDAAV